MSADYQYDVFAWTEPLHQVMKISDEKIDKITDSAKMWPINVHYERVIDEIQDPTLLLPRVTGLGQNFPNPAR